MHISRKYENFFFFRKRFATFIISEYQNIPFNCEKLSLLTNYHINGF